LTESDGSTVNVFLRVGDLVEAKNYIGVYRIERLSRDREVADIEQYNIETQQKIGNRMSVSVTILSPYEERARKARPAKG
jgi:hypothetical protein